MAILKFKTKGLLIGFVYGLSLAFPVFADDTEVFTSAGAGVGGGNANILFLVDNSGSMTRDSISRGKRVYDALHNVITNLDDVNVGLVQFSHPNAHIAYPVTPVDQSACILEPSECFTPTADYTINRAISTGLDDSKEYLWNSSSASDWSTLPRLDFPYFWWAPTNSALQNTPALRFDKLNIPQGATIKSAYVTFTIKEVDANNANPVTVHITGQNSDYTTFFTSSNGTIGSRPRTAASVTWNPAVNVPVNSTITTNDIKTIVQEIVDRPGWRVGSDMAFFFRGDVPASSGFRRAYSYEGAVAAGNFNYVPKLTIEVEYDASWMASDYTLTAGERLLQLVRTLMWNGQTPLSPALYEAARYLRGEAVEFGRNRGSSDGSNKDWYRRVSHPASYTGGAVSRLANCTDADLNHVDCASEEITGSATYISPLTDDPCQSNSIVLLTDGVATAPPYYSASDLSPPSGSSYGDPVPASVTHVAVSKMKTMIGSTSCAGTNGMLCGVDLAAYLRNTDQVDNATLDNEQRVRLYPISFDMNPVGNLNSQAAFIWMQDLADAGQGVAEDEGEFYSTNSTAELISALQNSITEIISLDSSFVAPSVTVNQFNRFSHRNELYFSVFKAAETPYWNGNVKRYKLDGPTQKIVDANNVAAVSETTGLFKSTAQSYWSDSVDGNEVIAGGAANELIVTNRKVFTYLGGNGQRLSLNHSDNSVDEDNGDITLAMLGAADTAEKTNLLKWARGLDVLDIDDDNNVVEIRKQLADPLHSQPVIVTYGGTNASPDSTVFFGTNEGLLYAIDADDGTEEFAYMPQELLGLIKPLYDNVSTTAHQYGVDGDITPWVIDVDGDGTVEPNDGDKVYLYFGLRRGGRSYYALDVTDRSDPKFMWSITGGQSSSDFEELGHSWSKPQIAKIQIGNQAAQYVLVFAGGYNAAQDGYTVRTGDDKGRAIFMVNPTTGALVWSGADNNAAGPAHGNHDETFGDMNYSIPAELRLLDMNRDGLLDVMFAGDMGGQVWRFDITNGANVGSLVSGGVIAQLSANSVAADNRRFYYPPDVAHIVDGDSAYLSIGIGSGWRAHPLDEDVVDRFYMIKDPDVFSVPGSYTKLTESDLFDATANLIAQGTTAEKSAAVTALDAADGWFIKLENGGEKVLAESTTTNNQIKFTTYEPGAVSGGCTVSLGAGRAYVVSVLDARPTINLDESNSALTKEDRSVTLKRGGIPSSPTVLLPDDAPPSIVIGPETPLNDFDFGRLSGRLYWREVGE